MRLYDTIRCWADGQNALNASAGARSADLFECVRLAGQRLRRHGSLADLAAGYYSDADWWPHVAREFALDEAAARIVRDAAYWQRFMELRHPELRQAGQRR